MHDHRYRTMDGAELEEYDRRVAQALPDRGEGGELREQEEAASQRAGVERASMKELGTLIAGRFYVSLHSS